MLDIGLIRAFVAIYDTGSVTLAAERLFLTQPTVSYALSRLREVLNDRLFVRDGRYMTPTLRADECYLQFSQILRQIEDVVSQGQGFDPAVSDRRFRIAMSDIATFAFLPPLMEILHRRAPDVEVEVVQPPIDDIPDFLATGKLDVAIGNLPTVSSLTASSLLMREHYVCLMSEAHSTIGETLSEKEFLAARHANVSSEFTGHKHLEQALQQAGAKRKISVQVKQFTVLPYLIKSTDYLAVIPSQVSKVFVVHGGLKELPLPIDIPEIEVRVHWDEQQGKNAPQKWFCDVIREALSYP
ncbi:DNA-binding transcriptional LysR family regulator [Pusillimonas noertemannii]|uniref:DNA-binding transcriptional LysR family regulator n=1 Tax=Pusillimonas noertemannii TaxID=305977 RepID=A0A2U1CQV4_9BURK|nr:DNA-binding transcriptional LysR family regulator [Pusillimonas noertemannii]